MLKQLVAKKNFNPRTNIFFFKFFLILLLLEGCLTKLTRKNFFSTYRVVLGQKIQKNFFTYLWSTLKVTYTHKISIEIEIEIEFNFFHINEDMCEII